MHKDMDYILIAVYTVYLKTYTSTYNNLFFKSSSLYTRNMIG